MDKMLKSWRIKTEVFYETKSMNRILFVNEDSANPGIIDC